MVNRNLPCWAPSHPDPSLIIITYCSTAIRICSRTGGPFYRGFTFFRLYLIAQSLGLFHRNLLSFESSLSNGRCCRGWLWRLFEQAGHQHLPQPALWLQYFHLFLGAMSHLICSFLAWTGRRVALHHLKCSYQIVHLRRDLPRLLPERVPAEVISILARIGELCRIAGNIFSWRAVALLLD